MEGEFRFIVCVWVVGWVGPISYLYSSSFPFFSHASTYTHTYIGTRTEELPFSPPLDAIGQHAQSACDGGQACHWKVAECDDGGAGWSTGENGGDPGGGFPVKGQ